MKLKSAPQQELNQNTEEVTNQDMQISQVSNSQMLEMMTEELNRTAQREKAKEGKEG